MTASTATVDLDAYRDEARAWLTAHTSQEAQGRSPDDLETCRAFQSALYDAGYAGITWPADCGGQGGTQAEQQVFDEEAAAHDLPVRPFIIGLGMCGPTVVDLGTTEQRERYVRPLLRGEEVWCQLFSEPGAGSDVASLATKAVRDGDEWVITGQKVWTSNAQWADRGAVLARTDVDQPKHQGLTMFIVDMHAPGVTVSPLVDMTGNAPFNEVFFDGVRVPADAVLGEAGAGWSAAVTMLGHERVSIGGMRQRRSTGVTYAALRDRARRLGTSTDPLVRDRLADLWSHERLLELFNARLRQEATAGRPPGARGSVGKLTGALNLNRAVDAAALIAGSDSVAWETDDDEAGRLATGVLSAPASGIAGGTNQIQRGIIGERILGLPKEPATDKGVPFRELKVGTQTKEA